MTQEPSYRAWIKSEGWMGFVTNLYMANRHAEVITDFDPKASCVGNTRDFSFNDIVLMRETGLKDKDDKIIWERDIVKTLICLGPGGETYVNMTVTFDPMEGWSIQTWVYKENKKFFPELLGNEFQNSDLL